MSDSQRPPAAESGRSPAPESGRPPAPARQRDRRAAAEQELVGGGRSQLGVDRALRARDVDRPTAAELAAADRRLVIIRRNWTPPA